MGGGWTSGARLWKTESDTVQHSPGHHTHCVVALRQPFCSSDRQATSSCRAKSSVASVGQVPGLTGKARCS